MKKTLITVVSVLSLFLILIGAFFLYEKLSEEYEPERNGNEAQGEDVQLHKAYDFEVVDGSGKAVKLSDFFGKPIVLNFWASWCPPCKAEMPDFEEAYKKYGQEINFLMVNATGGRETLATAKEFIKGTGYTFPVYFDTKYEASMNYSVSSLPTTVFIDKDGNIIAHAPGMLDAATLKRGIDMIYK